MPVEITRRPRTAADDVFLCRLYASTRMEELAAAPWSEEEKRAFLAEQYRFQTKHYDEHYPGAEYLVLEAEGAPVGRLYLCRMPEELRLMDIALLPEWRGRGIGGNLLGQVLASARAENRKVTCHVEYNNPALALYQRLGFETVEERGVYLFLQWQP